MLGIHDDIVKMLPAPVRKVLAVAGETGWELNGKGLSISLRLDHPTDDLGVPVYITWQLGTTPGGKVSCRFMSSGTATLQPLSVDDFMEYLRDPTIIYPEAKELEA